METPHKQLLPDRHNYMTILAAIQFKPPKGQPALAREKLTSLVGTAAKSGANVIVCPEMATTGYLWPDSSAIAPHAESACGPTFASLSTVAAEHQVWIVCGFPEHETDDLYNAALIVDPNGACAAVYRKILLYDADENWAVSGRSRELISTSFGTLCPAICMDLNDDDLLQFLWQSQPQILAFCTNWIEEGIDVHAYWKHRIWGWNGWFVAANTWGVEEGFQFSGRSAILAPGGVVVAEAPVQGDAIIYADMS